MLIHMDRNTHLSLVIAQFCASDCTLFDWTGIVGYDLTVRIGRLFGCVSARVGSGIVGV